MFDEFDLDTTPLPHLETELCAWAGRLAAATCHWLLTLAAFDRRDGWTGPGLRSCAHWLSWKCGISLRTAAEQVRVARALEHLPATRTAFADGRLSYSKVRALTRVATPTDDATWVQHALHCTAGQLDRLAAAWRSLHPTPDDQPTTRHDQRRCTWRWDPDGYLHLTARLPPDIGAALLTALDAARASLTTAEPAPDTDTDTDTTSRPGPAPTTSPASPASPHLGREGTSRPGPGPTSQDDKDGHPRCDQGEAARLTHALRPTPRDRRQDADALHALAEAFLTTDAPTLAGPTRHTVTVHVDARLLDHRNHPDQAHRPTPDDHAAGDRQSATPPPEPTGSDHLTTSGTSRTGHLTDADSATEPGSPTSTTRSTSTSTTSSGTTTDTLITGIRLPCCHAAPHTGLHPETVRRLACDALLLTLLTDPEGNPLAVGRAHRTPPARLRTALLARDRHCTYPGCEHTRWLHAHHIEHWGHGGNTDLDNLTLLCSYHHRTVHEGGTTLGRQPDGSVVAIRPDGTLVHPAPPTTAGHDPLDHLARATHHVTPTASVPRWHGDHLNLADSISTLIQASKDPQKTAA